MNSNTSAVALSNLPSNLRSNVFGALLLATTALSIAQPTFARADVDSCDDYASRHYRSSLGVVSATMTDVPRSGEFGPFKDVLLTVANTGDVPFDGTVPCDDPQGCLINVKHMEVKIGNHVASTWLPASLAPGAQTQLLVRLDGAGSALRTCSQTITIDTRRDIGQWGCGVFGDDSKRIRIERTTGVCVEDLIIRAPVFPFPGN